MRNPNHAIPSPDSQSATAQGYWETPVCRAANSGPWDPLSLLAAPHDVLGIDRRVTQRERGAQTDRAEASPLHLPLRSRFGLRCDEGWALVQAIAVSPGGILVRGLDWRSASPAERLALAAAMKGRCASALEVVGTCVLSQALIADLARWANPQGSQRPRETPVTLVGLPDRRPGGHGEARFEVAGRITPLTDPNPSTLAIACSSDALRELGRRLRAGTSADARRVTQPGSTQWVAPTASARCLNTRE